MTTFLDTKSVVVGAALALWLPLAWRWVKRHSNTQVHRINQ